MSQNESSSIAWFSRQDLDGFFGLFVDNLVQLLLIVALCGGLCGMSGSNAYLLFRYILPGAAVSILAGNIFYAWQARRLAKKENRDDVTALPYGINTPSLLIYVFFVMLPVYQESGNAKLAWQMGLLACFGSGMIELIGSLVAEKIRRSTPRAALLSSLCGIAIGFISMTFALQIWQRPLIAIPPLAIILITYFSKIRFPLALPGGLIAIVSGTLIAWLLPDTELNLSSHALLASFENSGFFPPRWSITELVEAFSLNSANLHWAAYLSVIIPMGLFNVIGSLQNIESAEAAGDKYQTMPSLAANGIGTILASCLGSCFPTTIYIGHPGWKGLGARAGYSTLNGIVISAICLTGSLTVVSQLIPLEACVAIVLWIGIVITAQAFQAIPKNHAPAVALGLFPAIAAWGATVMAGTFVLASQAIPDFSMQAVLMGNAAAQVNGFLIHGMNVLQQGYIFTSMILAAIAASLIDHKFKAAAIWSLIAALLSFTGLIHAYQVLGNSMHFYFIGSQTISGALIFPAERLALAYLAASVIFIICSRFTCKIK